MKRFARVGAAGIAVMICTTAVAQSAPPASRTAPRSGATRAGMHATSRQSLDTWLVTHYAGAQLLPDSAIAERAMTERASVERTTTDAMSMPRVESVASAVPGAGASFDTLYAVAFGTQRDRPGIRVGVRARLTASTGTVTALAAEIVARRAFRAPRVPGARGESDASWRYGWAYVALVPKRGAKSSAEVYRGWLLLDVPEPR